MPSAAGLLVAAVLAACTSTPTGAPSATRTDDAMASVNTVAEDRAVWQQLLSDHAKISRTVVHRQEGDRGIVEATTESDDPAVAERIQNHATAMQNRMKAGAQVRVWDEVFEELFKRHHLVTLELTMTEKGVKIVEWSTDPETIALLRSHAMGVSDFIREGHDAGSRATPRLPVGAPLPPPEFVNGASPPKV